MGMVADTAGHPSALIMDKVIAMGLESAIGTSACSDLEKNTELNTAMATGMDLEEGASPILAFTETLNETTPKAMDIDLAAASDSDTDRDGITTAIDNGGDMDLDLNIAPDMGLDITPIQLSVPATAMASVTAMDSNTGRNTECLVQPDTDGLDPNIGPDSGSDISLPGMFVVEIAITTRRNEFVMFVLDPYGR